LRPEKTIENKADPLGLFFVVYRHVHCVGMLAPNARITCSYPLSLKFAEGMNFESTDKLG
jgi:hypothetical protein